MASETIGRGKKMIDAYYQCFKQRRALDYTLQQFRKFYPPESSKIVMVNDGGEDFVEESEKYGCEYFYEENATKNSNLVFSQEEHLLKYVSRMRRHCHKFSNEYFILLEDDVLLMKNIDTGSLSHDINGCNKNEYLDPLVSKEIREHNEKLKDCYNIWYGACGGSVFRTKFVVELLDDMKNLENEVNKYCSLAEKQKWASDCFLSYLCLKSGGTIGQYSGFCETWYPDYEKRVRMGNIEVLHQYKELYI